MKALIAIDSFKGSLTSLEAGMAAEKGIKKVYPDAECEVLSVADGGEGTVAALTSALEGKAVTAEVSDPLGRKITCSYTITPDGTALMEMSAAAGITLLKKEELNPMNTTTYGVGEMIRNAIGRGCRNFIIGIGGSATNDGGAGMLQALGFSLLDKDGKEIAFGAKGLSCLDRISDEKVMKELSECSFSIACDVTNPLCGEKGCSAVFGPQKGATADTVRKMDRYLFDFAEKTRKIRTDADKAYPGSGAAGGLGFAFKYYLDAKLLRGIDLILREIHIEEKIREADIVITGEGRIDSQTVMGKAPGGVAEKAKKYGKPVLAFSGAVTEDAVYCNEKGIDAFFPVIRGVTTLEKAMDRDTAFSNMADCVEQAFRLIKVFRDN
ncbi:MAG: glycerate kinase [Clostridia bacterium]|nr:glycerate kinase [Clostridia bacterium]